MSGVLGGLRGRVIAVIFILAGGLVYLWWTGHYQPLQEEIASLEERRAGLEAAIDDNRRVVAAIGIDEIEDALAVIERQADQVAALVPEDAEDLPNIADRIDRLAEEHGVLASRQMPETATEGPFRVETYAVADVKGQYHRVAAFMTDLLNLDVITQIRDVEFNTEGLDTSLEGEVRGSTTRAGEAGEAGEGMVVSGRFTLAVFVYD